MMNEAPNKLRMPIAPEHGTEGEASAPEFLSILGEPIPLRFSQSNFCDQVGFAPVEVLVRTPFCEDFTVAGKQYELGLWTIAKTNLGLMYVVSVDGRVYKMLTSREQARAASVTAYDEAACITVFEGRRAIAQGVHRRDGTAIFRNDRGGEVRLAGNWGSKPTPELVRLLPLEVLVLFDRNLHTGLNRLVAPQDDPIAIVIPILVACCLKAEVHYDQGAGWGGSVGWDCNCSIF